MGMRSKSRFHFKSSKVNRNEKQTVIKNMRVELDKPDHDIIPVMDWRPIHCVFPPHSCYSHYRLHNTLPKSNQS